MKRIIKIILIFVLLAIGSKAYSQIGITYYYSSNAVAFNTSPKYKISAELKVSVNNYIEDLAMELDAFYNFKSKEYHRFSIGAGLRFDRLSGAAFTIPFLLEVFPFQEFKNVSFLLELTPEIYIEDQVNLRSLVGLRYTLGK
jgi:hypothetical protein